MGPARRTDQLFGASRGGGPRRSGGDVSPTPLIDVPGRRRPGERPSPATFGRRAAPPDEVRHHGVTTVDVRGSVTRASGSGVFQPTVPPPRGADRRMP